MKVFIIQGVNPLVPGTPMHARLTEEGANAEALSLVNIIRNDFGMQPATGDWKPALREAQMKRLKDESELAYLSTIKGVYGEREIIEASGTDVWITEVDAK